MEQKNDQKNSRRVHGINYDNASSGSERQGENAGGKDNNDQGQASFITGSTTGGGSDYGQGSSHLDGESYRQGDTVNSGSNYDNEAEGIGGSDIGTGDEGSFSNRLDLQDRDPGTGKDGQPKEGSRQDTGVSQDDFSTGNRQQNGSWSGSSTDDE